MSVMLCAPAAVAALAPQHPARHAAVAAAIGCPSSSSDSNLAEALKIKLVQLMRSTGLPSGWWAFKIALYSDIVVHNLMVTACCDCQVLLLHAIVRQMLRPWQQQQWHSSDC
jgi:hypothetical protein